MKKQEQNTINEICLDHLNDFNEQENNYILSVKRLRTCSAEVIETPYYYILKSYNTNIAFIEKRTGLLFDVLRYVYGYTATSSQHICKFKHDYFYTKEYTYKEV